MGSKLCIDKHVSNIEDLLEMNPATFSKLKIEENVSDSFTQHVKIWRYYEDDRNSNTIKSSPINLKDVIGTDFNFVSNECYLVLFVYKKQAEENSPILSFPHSIWGVMESYTNLTPRGLETPVTSSESISSLNKEALESFLLPKRAPTHENNKFEYMLFVWNGKTANPLMKAMTLSAALEFDTLISKGKDPFLQVLFSGGYVKNKKLWMGKVLPLESPGSKQNDADFEKRFDPMKETVYLLKFLFPSGERGLKPKGFKERFLRSRPAEGRQDDEYLVMGDGMDEEVELEDVETNRHEVNEGEYYDNEQGQEGYGEEQSPGISASLHSEYEDNPSSSRRENGMYSARDVAGHQGGLKKAIPRMNFNGIGDDSFQPNKQLKFGLQNMMMGKAADSNQNSEEERQPSSSDRTWESQSSKNRSTRRMNGGNANNNNRVAMPSLLFANLKNKISEEPPEPRKRNDPEPQKEPEEEVEEEEIWNKKRQFFSGQCSELLEGFLYVAGEIIAYNDTLLKEIGITHVLNAAGDACECKFSDRIKYLTYYIKDSRSENIECVFYEAISFIESARQEGGKVLVHCVQGISRSVALCMAYLIMKHEFTFDKAYNHVRGIRGIASPNPAFWAQLFNFWLRLYGPFEKIAVPRVFAIGSYQKETPQTLVARWLFETGNLFNAKSPKTLDPRGVIILQSKDSLYIWVGNEILPANKEKYIAKAEEYIKYLQQYEHASQDYSIIQQGEEPQEFWGLWNPVPEVKYGRNKEWDQWYVDLATHKNVVGTTMHEEQEPDEPIEAHFYPGLYCYPELEPLKGIDLEELMEENLLVLCAQRDDEKVAYVWRGNNVPPEVEDQLYLANVLRQRWPETDPSAIRIVLEISGDESESFYSYFE